MIAVVHGPIGCGKSTALRAWMGRRGWTFPRGYRTFFDSASLHLASWDGQIDVPIARREEGTGKVRTGAFNPAYSAKLSAFLDDAFSSSVECVIQQPLPALQEPVSASRSWRLDAECFWAAALECMAGDAARPLVIDELGMLETLERGRDEAPLREMVRSIQAARSAILVVQERALAFWKNRLNMNRPEDRPR